MVNLLPFFVDFLFCPSLPLSAAEQNEINPFVAGCGKPSLCFLICLQLKELYVGLSSTMHLLATGSRKQYREAPCNGPAPVHISH